ncbi:type II secretion system F family protein [Ornithinimicrobium faecis]|uniref:type II secretion system F family protein n=1 Tax=Ornithinimicrobium faecis TaxID=2934158 RepID=UPI002117ABA6|nr:type II secretion system F family protein [Ornithinimicrobium sp. HY1745]
MAKLLAAAVAAVGALMFWSMNPSVLSLALVGVLALVGWFVPDLILWNEGQVRSKSIEQALPDFLDQLTIAVEAGLGLESAMAHVCRNSGGPLADEFVRTLQDIQVGQTRRIAFLSLAERTSVKDLKRFVRAVVQAEQFGVSVATVLNTQAREMRIKRRLRAEEKAMKVPVKVVFPLMLCILPVLFIIILGPVAMRIAEAFSGGLGSIGGP